MSYSLNAQSNVSWSFAFDSETSQISIKAKMNEGWHIYSLDVDESIGPVPTSIEFNENDQLVLLGNVEAPEPKLEYDENFGGDLKFYENEVLFKQGIDVKESTKLSGTVVYMSCNNEMCYPPVEVNFELEINKESK